MPWGFSIKSKASSDLSHEGSHAHCIQTLKRNTLMLPKALRETDPSEHSHFERSQISSAPLLHIFPPNQAMVIAFLRAVYIHYGYLSLSPCFLPQPYTAALVYQAREQGYKS